MSPRPDGFQKRRVKNTLSILIPESIRDFRGTLVCLEDTDGHVDGKRKRDPLFKVKLKSRCAKPRRCERNAVTKDVKERSGLRLTPRVGSKVKSRAAEGIARDLYVCILGDETQEEVTRRLHERRLEPSS